MGQIEFKEKIEGKWYWADYVPIELVLSNNMIKTLKVAGLSFEGI